MTTRDRRGWTTPDDVVNRLRKRWDRGTYLTALAEGTPWEPICIPLTGPKPGDITGDLAAVLTWTRSWAADAGPLRVTNRRVGGRVAGTNDLPHQAWVDRPESLWEILGVADDVDRYLRHLRSAETTAPQLVGWIGANPLKVLAHTLAWPRLQATVCWLTDYQGPSLHIRQVDVPGVDTKFIENHRAILASLLDISLPPERIESTWPRANFAERFQFLRKPRYVRFRILDSGSMLAGFSELTVRADEFAEPPPGITNVYVVENETTYLAFPSMPGSIVIHGGGYAVTQLASLPWLRGTRIVYWGDLDTHGFAILNRLRKHFPHTESMLMDRSTLISHRDHWAREMVPTDEHLELLSDEEAEIYQSLTDGDFGQGVRLEQERIRFSALESALAEM